MPERMRYWLVLAEIERREGQLSRSREAITEVEPWLLRSGSVEHLCLFQLARARLMRDTGDLIGAAAAADEGVHLARRCGLGLYHIDLLIERARISFQATTSDTGHELHRAEQAVLAALNGVVRGSEVAARRQDLPQNDLIALGARHPMCQYAWGAGEGLALLAEIVAARGDAAAAHGVAVDALRALTMIQHPDTVKTRHFISRLA